MKFSKIIITGKTASGKNYLFNKLSEIIKNGLVKYTTRPIRKNETPDIDYKFIDTKKFLEKIESNDFIIYESFKINESTIWYYGISKKDFNESNLLILTPGEINRLDSMNLLNDSFIIYLDMNIELLKQRLIKRNSLTDTIERRLESDEKDFKDFNRYDLKIDSPDYKIEDILKSIGIYHN